jgi:signal transduction histidine kinase
MSSTRERSHRAGLEHRAELLTARAVAAERARIARELHDTVAHAVTVIVLHAAGGRRLLATEPARVVHALNGIEEQGREAMRELRRLLLELRGDAGAGSAATLGGPPDACDIGSLVDRVRSAGLPVRLQVEGGPRPLPPGVGAAAYRVVQEALTNVARHAGAGAAVLVRLLWANQLWIEVTDTGRGAGQEPSAGGHGLRGLRERVSQVDGWLAAGPVPGGGFRLVALLPVACRGAGRAGG